MIQIKLNSQIFIHDEKNSNIYENKKINISNNLESPKKHDLCAFKT